MAIRPKTLAEEGARYRQPFALTAEQFAELRDMPEADRNVRLGILAHAHEYEQRRRCHHHGAAFLMPVGLELKLAKEWASIREDLEADARAVFNGMVRALYVREAA